MTVKVKQLHAALKELESYSLPSQYQPSSKNDLSDNSGRSSIIDAGLLSRYEKAKSRYLHQRVSELLMEHVETFDGTSFEFPAPHNHQDKNDGKQQHIIDKVKLATGRLSHKINDLQATHESFQERKEELKRMVKDMESKKEHATFDENAEDTSSVDAEEMAKQEKRLSALVHRRMKLQAKLDRVKQEKLQLQKNNEKFQLQWDAMEVKDKSNNSDAADNNAADDKIKGPYSDNLSQVLKNEQRDRENMKLIIQQLNEKTAYYNSVKEAFEELGGIKILGVQEEEDNSDKNGDKNRTNDNMLLVKFLLLDKYILLVSLAPLPSSSKNKKHKRQASYSEHLVIKKCSLALADKSNTSGKSDYVYSTNRTVSLLLPAVSDLIPVANSLPKSENLRFLLRETISRARATEARAEELALLRKKFLTKIMKNGREIVCSLDEGITVRIQMTADCPIVNGSAYIEEIFGIGGWDGHVLEDVKTNVNGKVSREMHIPHSSGMAGNTGEVVNDGPITSIMNMLVDEVKQLKKPLTPMLPLLKKLKNK